MTVRLVEDALGELELEASSGYYVRKLDLGFPEVRAAAEPLVQADGSDDWTEHHGARAVSLDLVLAPIDATPVSTLLDDLRAFCHPGLRPWLYYTLDDGLPRRMRLRADQQGGVFQRPGSLDLRAAWRAPDGVQESADLVTSIIPAATDEEPGTGFDWSFDLTFPEMTPRGAVNVTNLGNGYAVPVIRMYGPCENPKIENQTLDERIEFAGLTIAAGDYVEVDVRTTAIRLNGESALSRFDLVDWPVSTLFRLARGVNAVRYYPDVFSGASEALVLYRHTWL